MTVIRHRTFDTDNLDALIADGGGGGGVPLEKTSGEKPPNPRVKCRKKC